MHFIDPHMACNRHFTRNLCLAGTPKEAREARGQIARRHRVMADVFVSTKGERHVIHLEAVEANEWRECIIVKRDLLAFTPTDDSSLALMGFKVQLDDGA